MSEVYFAPFAGPEHSRLIESSNRSLAAVPPHQPVPDDLRETIEESLDLYQNFAEEWCVFSGFAKIIKTKNGVSHVSHDFVDAVDAVGMGFKVVRFGSPGHQRWLVGLGFEKDSDEFDDDAEESSVTTYFLRPDAAYEIVPIEPIEAITPEGLFFPDEIRDFLAYRSEQVAARLRQPDFLELPQEEQLEIVSATVTDTRLEANGYDQSIINAPIGIIAQRGYILSREQGVLRYKAIDLSGITTKGNAMSVRLLAERQLVLGRPIRSHDDLVDPEAGLNLVVNIDAATAKQLGLHEGKPLFIPLSGQDVDMEFDQITIQHM